MAQWMNILRRSSFPYSGTNLFIKKVKRSNLKQNVHTANVSATNNVSPKSNSAKKTATYWRIAEENELDLSEILTKPQGENEIENLFNEIAQGDEKVLSQLRMLLYEIMIKREEENQMPSILKKQHWEELLKLQSLSRRKKYLNFLFLTEKKKESDKIKEILKRKDTALFEDLVNKHPHIYYGLSGYSMFLRIYSTTLSPVQDLRALTNKFFAPPILFDCSYQEYMNSENTKNCAEQLALSVQLNKMHPHPFTLQLFNLNKEDLLMKYLQGWFQNIENKVPSFEIYENSYLDMYPKERLVYLTPHTKYILEDFRPDNIYIIGAFVDKGYGTQASLAKAKEQGLRMARLPLDKYLLWRKGSKSLTLNNVLNILLDFRFYKNWEKALKSVPRRNL